MCIRKYLSDMMLAGVILFGVGLQLIFFFTPPYPYPAVIMLPNILWNLWLMILGVILYITGIFIGLVGLCRIEFTAEVNENKEHQ